MDAALYHLLKNGWDCIRPTTFVIHDRAFIICHVLSPSLSLYPSISLSLPLPVLWSGEMHHQVRRLQNAQNKAARIVLRWRYGSSVVVIRNVLGWSSINKIIEKKHANLFHNIHHLKRPSSIHNGIQLVKDRHSVNTRNRLSTIYVISRQERNRQNNISI